MSRILIVHSSFDGQTRRIAERMAVVISRAGHAVTVLPADLAENAIEGSDAVLVGGAIRYGRFASALERLVRRNAQALATRRNAFFCVCLSARNPDSKEASGYIEKFGDRTGWHPARAAVFAGALLYRQYGAIKRLVMKLISKAAGGETDTSRDYEYTDWRAVERFAAEFAAA